MESVRKQVELQIGVMTYNFEIEFDYYEGNSKLDPTDQEGAELEGWNFYTPIIGWNNETETEHEVTNIKEIAMIKDWLDIEELFMSAIS